jgi:hypothetical protein
MNRAQLKDLIKTKDPAFWSELAGPTRQTVEFDDLFFLSALRKKAKALGLVPPESTTGTLRLALLGGCSLYPLHELLVHLLETDAIVCG